FPGCGQNAKDVIVLEHDASRHEPCLGERGEGALALLGPSEIGERDRRGHLSMRHGLRVEINVRRGKRTTWARRTWRATRARDVLRSPAGPPGPAGASRRPCGGARH